MRRQYKNEKEQALATLAESKGWKVSKRGWPDFMCWRGEEFIAVEVKPRRRDGKEGFLLLKREQARCMDFLTRAGIRCYVSDGLTLEPYDRAKHAPESRRRHPMRKAAN